MFHYCCPTEESSIRGVRIERKMDVQTSLAKKGAFPSSCTSGVSALDVRACNQAVIGSKQSFQL